MRHSEEFGCLNEMARAKTMADDGLGGYSAGAAAAGRETHEMEFSNDINDEHWKLKGTLVNSTKHETKPNVLLARETNADQLLEVETRRRLMIVASPLSLFLLLLLTVWIGQSESFFIDEKQSPKTSEWNYNDQLEWPRMNRECEGRAQSPIDIKQRNVIISHQLRLHFYNYDKQIKFKLANAHHTVKMNPVGPAYEQDLEQPNGHNRLGFNSSSIHEMMTADEFVEFTPTSNQRPSSNAKPGDNHLGRLLSSNSSRQPASRQPGHEPNQFRDQQQLNAVEHERELEHGQSNGGGGLFGFHLAKEKIPVYEGAPTIKLDWLDDDNNEYKLRDIHFHWGERRDNGSEHAIDGRRAAMEMHLVHIKRGLDKSNIGFTSDSVAVIAILVESHRKSNLDFNPIVNELARINSSTRAQEVDYKSLYDLLPNNLQAFYTYSGSLTTPPCYQVVNWIVMAERLNMNAKQIEMFRNLYAPPPRHNDDLIAGLDEAAGLNHLDDDHHEDTHTASGSHLIMPNVRTLQALNNRTIMASFTKHGGRLDTVTYSYNSANTINMSLYPLALFITQIMSIWLTRGYTARKHQLRTQ